MDTVYTKHRSIFLQAVFLLNLHRFALMLQFYWGFSTVEKLIRAVFMKDSRLTKMLVSSLCATIAVRNEISLVLWAELCIKNKIKVKIN